MSEKRVLFNNIVQSQLPAYVREEFPLISDFLKQYYIAQEYQGAPVDLIQNIDRYIKLDETTNLVESAFLGTAIDFDDTTILVDGALSPQGTDGFPKSYGLLKIGNEIITYTGKTDFSFTGCIRGFSGVTSYKSESDKEQLVFDSTIADGHESGSVITNLSCLFLKEFLLKTKKQILPGIESINLSEDLNEKIFLKHARDFYLAKGTDRGFEVLFKALYNENVKIVKPADFLNTPSNAQYRITNDIVVEPIVGDPTKLEGSTLFQDPYGTKINRAYGPITYVEKIRVGVGETYYKLVFDAGYNRDVRVSGSIYGDFRVQPKTQSIGRVSSGSTTITVDSTVGFEVPGELYVNYDNFTSGIVSYTSKSLNQFFGCSNITGTIPDKAIVGINTFAHGTSAFDDNEVIEVRINSVLNNLSYPDNTSLYGKGDTARIKTFGILDDSFTARNWIYNTSPSYIVNTFSLLDSSDNTFRLNLNVDHYFNLGDSVTIQFSDNQTRNATIIGIPSSKAVTIRGQGFLPDNLTYIIKRNLLNVLSNSFVEASKYTANIQNLYKSRTTRNKYLVAAPSIPYYRSQPLVANNRSVTFSGTFSGNEFAITSVTDHGFYTGDAVYYIPEKEVTTTTGVVEEGIVSSDTITTIKSSLFDEGLYFVERVSPTVVKFARSRSDIYNSKYITLSNPVTVSNNNIVPHSLRLRRLETQKLLREIVPPRSEGVSYKTNPGFTGILINGVEILNYKSNNSINYGKIEKINVLSGGSNYDILNPPVLIVSDPVGTGATGYAAISGGLQEIRVIDSGFDYEQTPKVTISGGNGSGATASVTMKQINHSVSFNSQFEVGIGSTVSTIGFGTYHKFRNGENIVYSTGDQKGVGGISTNSTYYVSVQNEYTVKLHDTQGDAISGINTISLTSYGEGNHTLRSINKKLVVEAINITSSGEGYENKKRTTTISGINTALNSINIENHDYKSGEILKYTCEGTAIGGLNSGSEYYITKVDTNNFKLSQINVGAISTQRDLFYREKEYVDLNSVGVGTHIFNYQDISVILEGKVGISSVGSETFEAKIQPIFRGEVTSVHLSNKGVGYGSSEVINFERNPLVTLSSGSEAQVQAVVNNGRITEVIVLSRGKNYTSVPDLTIIGDGNGAVLTPIVKNGRLESVKVLSGGIGFTQSTFISVSSPGQGVEFKPILQEWTINLFEKNLLKFTDDDGFLTVGNNEKYGLQYSHLYASRKLREGVFSVDQGGEVLYGQPDLRKINSVETSSIDHSPIIGWAYDGHPIYGPYGYSRKSGGSVSRMKSGYKISLKENRPPISLFPEGFFVNDYTHYKVSDETILDENNGRFCVTPEFPNGTYAYFATINNVADSSGPFTKYRRPVFPYLVGDNFKRIPHLFNFEADSNQDSISLDDSEWSRITTPYNLIEDTISYDYAYIPNNLAQTVDVQAISPGSIDSIGITSGGTNYKVGDSLIFDSEGTLGNGVAALVSKVKGKEVSNISVATTSISNAEFYPSDLKNQFTILTQNPHNLTNNDLINVLGLSTTSSQLENYYDAGISSSRLTIAGLTTTSYGIGSATATGIVTYFEVTGNLNSIRENDILNVESERVKVLNIDQKTSRIRVLREIDGTVGTAHSARTFIYEDPRKITINVKTNKNINFSYENNKQLYFNPSESVALGTSFGVGIGTTITFSNPGTGITQIFIPTKSIYIPQHNLKTGDLLTYNTNGGSGIIVSEEGNVGVGTTLTNGQNLFAVRINEDLLGFSTVRVGLDTTGTFVGIASTYRDSRTLYFTGVGTGVYHSFTTNYEVLTGEVTRNRVTVSTASTHGLNSEHTVFVKVNPLTSRTFYVRYNDHHRRLIINPVSFTSVNVNTLNDTITIADHGFKTGDKIIHTSGSPSGGLEHNKIYYIVRVDNNNFKLSTTYYNSTQIKPIVVRITSASSGTINPVNPRLDLYKNSTITFDLTHSSLSYTNFSTLYPAFDLNFYLDKQFTKPWEKSFETSRFNVQKFGIVGVTADAKVVVDIDDTIPEIIYYRLEPIFESNIPSRKLETISDFEVHYGSSIHTKNSVYNGQHKISIASSTSFTYTLIDTPENSSYNSTSSLISYETDCTHAYGPISEVRVSNPGRNYYSLPGITSITSRRGTGALLDPISKTIGRIKTTRINDIGYNFPSDDTLRPSVNLPQVIKIKSLASLQSVGISSVGRGYITAPDLIVIDSGTDRIVKDIDLKYELGKSDIQILKNTYGISNLTPRIVPVHNSNGVGISTISYNPVTKNATVTLNAGFSDTNSFPFKVNDKVLVENVSIGIGSTSRGYNSNKYGFKLFTITETDENIGGIGATVTFNLSEYFTDLTTTPGVFDTINNSAARIIPEKYFPKFNVILETNDFGVGEVVESNSSTGVVESWDSRNGILRVSSNKNFLVGEIIKGKSTKTQGVASEVNSPEAFLNLESTSKVVRGWQVNSGFLNDDQQRIQDSDYYQNFSYSLRSRIPYEVWNESVSALNHTVGLKRFSDYQLESSPDNEGSMVVGISTEVTSLDVVSDLVGFANINCVYDFDLVKERTFEIEDNTLTTEILFANRILTDYEESVGNRVLSVDDMSGLFNSNPRPTPFEIISTFNVNRSRAQKFITLVKDRRYLKQRQLMIVDMIHDGSIGYFNEYARLETAYDQGTFDFSVFGDTGRLLFYPRNYTLNDYDVSSISYRLDDDLVGYGSSIVGPSIIKNSSVPVTVGVTTTIVAIGKTYSSAKILVEITPDLGNKSSNKFEYNQLNIVHNGADVSILEYGRLSTSQGSSAISGFGTYFAYLDGSLLKVDFTPDSGSGIGTNGAVNSVLIGLGNSTVTGVGTFAMKHAKIVSKTTSISPSGSPTQNVIAEYKTDTLTGYDAAYCLIQACNLTNNQYQLSEFVVLDDYQEGLLDETTYDTEFGIVETLSGIGTIGSRIITSPVGFAATVQILFTPIPGVATRINTFMNALRGQDDSQTVVTFAEETVRTGVGVYEGTERDIKKAFELYHRENPIFQREFLGNDTSVVDSDNDVIIIPNHFFVTGEAIKYFHGDRAIGIAATSFPGVGVTNRLPEDIFAIKVDNNKIKIASSAENALKSAPEFVNITSVGIGTSHRFVSTNPNARVIISLDNNIQSPLVATSTTTILFESAFSTDDILNFEQTNQFLGGDLVRIGNEIMSIDAIGIGGSSNKVRVRRSRLGTFVAGYSTGSVVTKVTGNFNIVNNTLNFVEPPFGNTPLGTTTNPPSEVDWVGISTGSSFHGRVFMRSGIPNSSDSPYSGNYIFDDISQDFNSQNNEFILKSEGQNVTGIANQNAIILINDIFQGPGASSDYVLTESAGITTVKVNGVPQSVSYDVGISSFPRGGVIISVAVDSKGIGYQPLVAAGGTVVVSSAGTIQSISIGNSGSGYRSGIQTVNVSVRQNSVSFNNIVAIGTAQIADGHITSVSIANTDVFYAPREISDLLYDNTSGVTTVRTSSAHGLIIGDEITLTGVAMTCDYAPAVDVVNAIYDHTTGITTITTSTAHGLSTTGQRSNVVLTGLGFTCDLDLGASIHYYPRPTDPAYCGAQVISIGSSTEFTVGVGSHVTEHFYNSGGTVQASVTFPRASDPIKANARTLITKINSTTDFEINSGISTRKHFYSRCGSVEKSFDVVFDSPLSYTNIPLIYSSASPIGIGSSARVDVVVGQGSSVIDFKFTSNGYGYKQGEILTIPFGGATGIPTSSSYNEFQITIDEVFTDEFTGWSLGTLQVLDSIERYIDGTRRSFPLSVASNQISIVAGRGSLINVQDVLVIFVNSILQVPGKGYQFEGGSTVTFTEPLKVGDDVKILFYKGSGAVDVISREILETVKLGDFLQIGYDSSIGQPYYFQEDERGVIEIKSVDSVNTNPYFGPGKNSDSNLLRPVVWCRQTEDKIVNEQEIGKDRELYEPVINPVSNIIRSVGVGASILYVDRIRPLFDGKNENDTLLDFQDQVTLISQKTISGAAATAIVAADGTISSIVINDGGSGYVTAPLVSIGGTEQRIGLGVTAVATSSINSLGSVTSISITNSGSGYSRLNPPPVLVSPPSPKKETNDVASYIGDSGTVVSYGVSTFNPGGNKMILDLHIPFDSPLRDTKLVGTAVTLTSLSVGDYFVVTNSHAKIQEVDAFETFEAFDYWYNNRVGVSTNFIDTVYQVEDTELVQISVSGVTTTAKRVFSRISGVGSTSFSSTIITKDSTIYTYDNIGNQYPGGISTNSYNYFGDFSWGKITLIGRSQDNEFDSYAGSPSFYSGISTSDIVQRTASMKFKNYIV